MRYVYVTSARRNPDSNPKEDYVAKLTRYYNLDKTFRSFTYFISFTKLPKIGINPTNAYSTPIGIYTYPLRLVYDEYDGFDVPFAGDRPYIQVLRINTKKILSDANYKNLDADCKKLEAIYQKLDTPPLRQREAIAERLERFLSDDKLTHYLQLDKLPSFMVIKNLAEALATAATKKNKRRVNRSVQILWSLTQILAMLMANSLDGQSFTVKWNWLFRHLGYDVIIDKGLGFIHFHEKVQALFLTPKAFIHEDTLDNKTHRMLPDKYKKLPKYLLKFDHTIRDVETYEKLASINPDIRRLKGTDLEVFEKDGRLVIAGGRLYNRNAVLHDFDVRVNSRDNTWINCNFYLGTFSGSTFENCSIRLVAHSFRSRNSISTSTIKDSVIESGRILTSDIINCEIRGGSFGLPKDTVDFREKQQSERIRRTVITNSVILPQIEVRFDNVLFRNCRIEGVDKDNREIFVDCDFE